MTGKPNAMLPVAIVFSILGLILGLFQGNPAFYSFFVLGLVFLAMSFSKEVSEEIAADENEDNSNAR